MISKDKNEEGDKTSKKQSSRYGTLAGISFITQRYSFPVLTPIWAVITNLVNNLSPSSHPKQSVFDETL